MSKSAFALSVIRLIMALWVRTMIDTCLINTSTKCSKVLEINSYKKSADMVQIAYAFDWKVQSDTPASIYDFYQKELVPLAKSRWQANREYIL